MQVVPNPIAGRGRRHGVGRVGRVRAIRFALATLLAAGAAIAAAGPADAKPAFTPEEKAAAIVRPAVVYVEIQWEGWVRDKVSGKLWDENSVVFASRCSGFSVSNDGFIVTAGHCVDPGVEGVGLSFFEEIAARYVDAGIITQSDTGTLINDMLANAEVEGQTAGDPAVRKVFAQRGVAKSGLTSGEAMQARVVSFHPVSGGDVALLKVEKTNTPMVKLANSADINVGTDVLAIGYPASADAISDATFEPSNKDGKISNKRTEGGVPFYETSAATTQGMSGGPVANLDGEIIGLVSHGPAAEKQAFNFLAASSLIAEELSKSGVKNDLGKIDTDYRDGLNAYYDGRYSDSIERFDAVLAAVPSHAQAQEYRQKAVGLRETEGDPGLGKGLLLIGGIGGLLVLVIIAVVIVVVVSRGRKRPAMAGAYPGLAPVAYPPVSGAPQYGPAPVSWAPQYGPALTASAQPDHAAPVYSGPPAQAAAPIYAGPPAQAAAPPISAPPVSAPPISAPPVSAPPVPVSAMPVSPTPASPMPVPMPPVPQVPAPVPQPPAAVVPTNLVVPTATPSPPAPAPAPATPSLQYCSNCGTGSPAGTKFCATCGQQFP